MEPGRRRESSLALHQEEDLRGPATSPRCSALFDSLWRDRDEPRHVPRQPLQYCEWERNRQRSPRRPQQSWQTEHDTTVARRTTGSAPAGQGRRTRTEDGDDVKRSAVGIDLLWDNMSTLTLLGVHTIRPLLDEHEPLSTCPFSRPPKIPICFDDYHDPRTNLTSDADIPLRNCGFRGLPYPIF